MLVITVYKFTKIGGYALILRRLKTLNFKDDFHIFEMRHMGLKNTFKINLK